MGTYNYGNPNFPYALSMVHVSYDVNPWMEFGNVKGVSIPSIENSKYDTQEAKDNWNNYNNYINNKKKNR